jgi:alkylhydroperoxidase/carboxymuconolactone decarboxylase family protein YurZ
MRWIPNAGPITQAELVEAIANVEWEAGGRATSGAVRVAVEMWKANDSHP